MRQFVETIQSGIVAKKAKVYFFAILASWQKGLFAARKRA